MTEPVKLGGYEIELANGRKVWCGLDEQGKVTEESQPGIAIRFVRELVSGPQPVMHTASNDGTTTSYMAISIDAAYALRDCIDAVLVQYELTESPENGTVAVNQPMPEAK